MADFVHDEHIVKRTAHLFPHGQSKNTVFDIHHRGMGIGTMLNRDILAGHETSEQVGGFGVCSGVVRDAVFGRNLHVWIIP